jgi:hypothetical protein
MLPFDEQFAFFKQNIENHRSESKEKQHYALGLASEDAIFKLQAVFNSKEDALRAIDSLLAEQPHKFSRGEDFAKDSTLVYARLH